MSVQKTKNIEIISTGTILLNALYVTIPAAISSRPNLDMSQLGVSFDVSFEFITFFASIWSAHSVDVTIDRIICRKSWPVSS